MSRSAGSPGSITNRPWLSAAMAAILLAVSLFAVGCAGGPPLEGEEEPKTASDYMVDLNDRIVRLQAKLDEFAEAADEGRISAMQTKAQEAYEVLDEMADLEAPDDVSDLQDQYDDAASQLKGALEAYMTLYTEIYDSTQTGGFDYSTYSQRIEEVQKQYDDALTALEEADKQATKM